MRYSFQPVIACNMCEAKADEFALCGMRLNGSQGMHPQQATGICVSVKQCTRCGLVFADPQPIPDSLEDHYGIPPDSYWKNLRSEVPSGYFQRQIAEAKQLLGSRRAMAALDIGVGQGNAMVSLIRAGFETTGIEPTAPFRDYAIRHTGLPPSKIIHAGIEDAEFPAGSFDFITFGAVLEHLYDPGGSLEKCFRWLRPRGVIHAEVPSSAHLMQKLINLYFRLRGTNFVTNLSPMHPPYHLYEFGLRSFELHGESTGYQISRHYYDVCSIYHLPKVFHPPLHWWMDRTNSGMQLTVYLQSTGNPA